MLEQAAREFIVKETAAGELQRQRPNPEKIARAVKHLIARLRKASDAASKADAHAEFAAQAEAWAEAETRAAAAAAASRHRRSTARTSSSAGRKPEANRDWLFERLLFIWEECGGETRSSPHSGGGPLVRFLRAACDPVFRASSRRRDPLTEGQAHQAVQKLLRERGPQDRP